MIHVFKSGGEHISNGKAFTLKCINDKYLDDHLADGWFTTLEKALASEAQEDISESGSDYEAILRAEITALGGKAGGRSSIKTLEKQLAELKNDSEN